MNQPPNRIYCISGLGADHRAFQNLQLPGYELIHVHWVAPSSNDTIESYASKLLHQIPEERPTLIGLSFGGIIAIEIAKQIETTKVIIISSVKTADELPFYFKFLGKLNFQNWIPAYFFKHTNPISNWLFGANSQAEKKLLQDIFSENDITFLRWCLTKMAHWKNKTEISNLVHIHGSADALFPQIFIRDNYRVRYGRHLMILSESTEISKLILDILKKVEQ